MELKEAEILKRRRDEVVSRLAASWARGWALDTTNAAIQLIPEWLLPEFEALVRDAWARNPKGPQRTAEQIIESHLKRDPELRRKVERTLS